MSENYSLNHNFGFNVSKGNINSNTVQQVAQNVDESVGNLFDNMTGYVAKYENVFNGDVTNEINMYTRQSMMVGMSMRAEEGRQPHFDMNI